ncbi:MAG: hypothetical protein H6729_16040 [Deltaproteobacteria bacterium]|nr:hypothetical protein [Deltaproteobacteria bacterium]
MGYFERHGHLSASSSAWVPIERGQLDDVLKTAVVRGKGRPWLEYDPPDVRSVALQEAGLPSELAADPNERLSRLLDALVGTWVRARTGRGDVFEGRLLGTSIEKDVPTDVVLLGAAGLTRRGAPRIA